MTPCVNRECRSLLEVNIIAGSAYIKTEKCCHNPTVPWRKEAGRHTSKVGKDGQDPWAEKHCNQTLNIFYKGNYFFNEPIWRSSFVGFFKCKYSFFCDKDRETAQMEQTASSL